MNFHKLPSSGITLFLFNRFPCLLKYVLIHSKNSIQSTFVFFSAIKMFAQTLLDLTAILGSK